jgi:hypothetical protein
MKRSANGSGEKSPEPDARIARTLIKAGFCGYGSWTAKRWFITPRHRSVRESQRSDDVYENRVKTTAAERETGDLDGKALSSGAGRKANCSIAIS